MTALFNTLGLLNRIQSFLDLKGQKNPIKAPLMRERTIWEEMLDIDGQMQWGDDETNILLESEKLKPFCHAVFRGFDEKPQTVLLGIDLHASQLLIDEFFPRPPSELIANEFELIFNGTEGLLILKVEIKEKVRLGNQPAFLVNILSKKRVFDRRLNSRIQFSRNTAPKIELIVPLTDVIRGHLLDLSSGGLTMVCFGPKKHELMTNTGECTLFLSDHIKIKARMRIKQINHNRRPNNHTTFRVMFTQPTDLQNDQLNAFILSFEALKNNVAA